MPLLNVGVYIQITTDVKNFVAVLQQLKQKVQEYKGVEYEFKNFIEINAKGGLE